jgi:hypothetical protein
MVQSGHRQRLPLREAWLNVRFWHKADIPLAATNVGLGGKADITVDGPECPLMTQSGHCPDQHEKRVECHFALAAGRKVLGF